MAKCKTCGHKFPDETIERMLERFENYNSNQFGLFTVAECEAKAGRDIIVNQWPALIRGLMAKADASPLLTPETVDEIPDSVCDAVTKTLGTCAAGSTSEYHGRRMLRAVAAHCRVPMQASGNPGALDTAVRKERFRARECASASGSYWAAEDTETGIVAAGFSNESQAAHAALAMQASYDRGRIEASPQPLDTAEADAVIGAAINSLRKDTREGYGLAYAHMCSLRSLLTLKPRRLTDAEALELSEFADSRVPAEAVAGHSIAREVARLWRMEVPEERPAECDHRILAARKAPDEANAEPDPWEAVADTLAKELERMCDEEDFVPDETVTILAAYRKLKAKQPKDE